MSRNIINTTVHHTFKFLPPAYTEDGIPCFSQVTKKSDDKKDPHYPFLGEGYYFWDFNLKRAQEWGKKNYGNDYKILETSVTLQGDNFLDLVGSRQDLSDFLKVLYEMKRRKPGIKLGEFFYGMQCLERKKPGTWPFSIIRALNVKSNAKKISFNHVPNSEMLLNPEIIVCFYNRNEINMDESCVI